MVCRRTAQRCAAWQNGLNMERRPMFLWAGTGEASKRAMAINTCLVVIAMATVERLSASP